MSLLEGKYWFSLESKSFEILTEIVKGKVLHRERYWWFGLGSEPKVWLSCWEGSSIVANPKKSVVSEVVVGRGKKFFVEAQEEPSG